MSSLLKRKSKKPEMDEGEGKPGLAVAYSMKKKSQKMAGGGDVMRKFPSNGPTGHEKGVNKAGSQTDPGTSVAHLHLMEAGTDDAKWKQRQTAKELSKTGGPTSGKSGFAEGGTVDCPSCGHNFDMGGEMADTQPNDFDVLDQDTIPMDSDTAENSGDEDGTPEIVKRAMKRRSSK